MKLGMKMGINPELEFKSIVNNSTVQITDPRLIRVFSKRLKMAKCRKITNSM